MISVISDGSINESLNKVGKLARQLGLTATFVQSDEGAVRYGITVERPESAGDWSLPPTKIAIGQGLREVSGRALVALREMAPRLQKKLAEGTPDEPDGITIAGGVGSDGTVTALRVERDGTVRLHPDDIEAIADAVFRKFSTDGVSATVMDAGGGEVKLRLAGGEEYPEIGSQVLVKPK